MRSDWTISEYGKNKKKIYKTKKQHRTLKIKIKFILTI
jgi:hypothetical protein